MDLEIGARSHTGRVRKNNEDSFRLAPEQSLFVLCDGMGGQAHGEIASSIAADAVIAHCGESRGNPSMPLIGPLRKDLSATTNRLISAVRLANDRIHRTAQEVEENHGMGATVVALQLDDRRVSLVNAGDSRAYRLRTGHLEQLTEDHSLVAEQVRQGRMTPREARESPMQSVLLRALGVEPEIEVDASEELFLDGDILLLCSDGLTREVPDEKIAGVLAESPDARTAADRLVELANEAGGEDNITVIVLRTEPRSRGPLLRLGRWLKRAAAFSRTNGGR